MKRVSLMIVALSALAVPATYAQTNAQMHVAQAGASQSAAMSEAEVRKVDKDAAKITLKHGEIKSLDMPPMTMVFQVKDKSMLDQVKAGDKVRFRADKIGGALTITAIEPAR